MINNSKKVLGLIGHPVEHSISHIMHNAAFEYMGLDNIYTLFDVSKNNLPNVINGAKSLGIMGFNVTIPYKTDIIKYLDVVDDLANVIGAVNTIKFESIVEEGTNNHDHNHNDCNHNNHNIVAKGFNTDGIGDLRAINEVSSVKGKKVLILGSGGASRAVAFQLAISGVEDIVILNRTEKNANNLVKDIGNNLSSFEDSNVPIANLSSGSLNNIKNNIKNSDILINTTSVGMYPNINQSSLVTNDLMHSDLIVHDLIYNPLETGLIKEAKIAGATTISGLKMLLYQGVESFKIWTGLDAPVKVMEDAIINAI
ncbi:MAG: shikimate dehydrogenase [Methanobacteriaceae archaeon]